MQKLENNSPNGSDKASSERTIRKTQKKATFPHTCKVSQMQQMVILYVFYSLKLSHQSTHTNNITINILLLFV